MKRLALGVLAVLLLVGCGPQPTGPEPTAPSSSWSPRVRSASAIVMDFDEEDATVTTSDQVEAEAILAGGANVVLVQSGDGTSALRFPPWSGAKDSARFVIVMKPKGSPDVLAPRSEDFSFGADVKLDAKSTGAGEDNGDNILQRGLFSDSSQFKLQVDKRIPSCTVKAPRANLFVKLPRKLDDGWFRLSCERTGRTLIIVASRVTPDGEQFFEEASVTGDLADLDFPTSVPVVIGGKIAKNGELVLKQSDQFNGELDNVFLDIPTSGK